MKPVYKPIIAALVFAVLLIASAYFLKGNSAKVWVQALIYGLGFYFVFRYSIASPKKCTSELEQE